VIVEPSENQDRGGVLHGQPGVCFGEAGLILELPQARYIPAGVGYDAIDSRWAEVLNRASDFDVEILKGGFGLRIDLLSDLTQRSKFLEDYLRTCHEM
jgi:hypothetical protein